MKRTKVTKRPQCAELCKKHQSWMQTHCSTNMIHSLYIHITNLLTQISKRFVSNSCAQKHSVILEHKGATQGLGEQTVYIPASWDSWFELLVFAEAGSVLSATAPFDPGSQHITENLHSQSWKKNEGQLPPGTRKMLGVLIRY